MSSNVFNSIQAAYFHSRLCINEYSNHKLFNTPCESHSDCKVTIQANGKTVVQFPPSAIPTKCHFTRVLQI